MDEVKFRAWDGVKMFEFDIFNQSDKLMRDNYEGKNIIMQYTGLKDINGKEIYEGDVVRTNYGNFEVGFGEYIDNDFYSGARGCFIIKSNWCGNGIPEDCEKIGNIYENPELLNNN